MSSTREIITLQLGNYANYVGTHWWNIQVSKSLVSLSHSFHIFRKPSKPHPVPFQEATFNYNPNALEKSEINHDVLFREGENQRGQVTYTPRMLLLDLAGSLSHMPMDGELYEDLAKAELLSGDHSVVQAHAGWESCPVEVIKTGTHIEKPKFLKDLDENSPSTSDPEEYKFHETVQSWTDYMYTRYHPRSINVIQEYKSSAGDDNAFDTFTNGRALWPREYINDLMMDKTRMYLEESNNCQGFQVLFDCSDGFTGLSMKCLDELEDDYGKTIFAIPLIAPRSTMFRNCDNQMSTSIRVANTALTFASLIDSSSLFLPLSTMETCWRDVRKARQIDGVNYIPDNLYQTSAILATYLDTITLKYRLTNSSSTNLTGFCSDLNNYGRKLVAGGLAMPFPMNTTEDLIDCLDRNSSSRLFTDLSPNCNIGAHRIVQSMCLRGVPEKRLKQPLKTSKGQSQMAAYRCETSAEMMQLFYQCLNHASLSHCSTASTGITTRVPFPLEIFDERVSQIGFQFNRPGVNREKGEYVKSFPSLATAQNANELADMISSLHREASRIKIDKIYRFKETGLDPDEYKEALEKLLDFQDLYEEKFDL